MGINNSQTSNWITDRYNFIDTLMIEQYGQVPIFKKKQQNYDYIAIMRRTVQKEYLKQIQRQLSLLNNKKIFLPFIKIFQIKIGKEYFDNNNDKYLKNEKYEKNNTNFICQNQKSIQSINICIQFLTYTLKQYLYYKKNNKYQITLKQYSYIMKTALIAAQFYQNWKLYYLQLNIISQLIYIKSNGEIKIMPFRSKFLKYSNNQCVIFSHCDTRQIFNRKSNVYEFPTNSSNNSRKRENRYLKQLKQLSLQLFLTINPNIDPFVRSIPNINQDILLSQNNLNTLKQIQNSLIDCRNLGQFYHVLKDLEEDFLVIDQYQNKTAQIQINNPESYQAFIQHLHTVKSYKKSNQIHKGKQQKGVARNIFLDSSSQSQSHTVSNPSPQNPRQRSKSYNFSKNFYTPYQSKIIFQ